MVARAFGPLVALAGAAAAVAGIALLVLDRLDGFGAAYTVLGFALVAWVIFHPARQV